jgi:hypothetical protein
MAGFSLMGDAVHAGHGVYPPAAFSRRFAPDGTGPDDRMIAFSRHNKPTYPAARVCFDIVKAA